MKDISQMTWECSSDGRALDSHAGGTVIDSPLLQPVFILMKMMSEIFCALPIEHKIFLLPLFLNFISELLFVTLLAHNSLQLK